MTASKTTTPHTNGKKMAKFSLIAAPGSRVYVVGTFNNWDPKKHLMKDNPNGGVFRTSVIVPRGRHEYKFVVDGTWLPDPNGWDRVPDGFGSTNSVLVV